MCERSQHKTVGPSKCPRSLLAGPRDRLNNEGEGILNFAGSSGRNFTIFHFTNNVSCLQTCPLPTFSSWPILLTSSTLTIPVFTSSWTNQFKFYFYVVHYEVSYWLINWISVPCFTFKIPAEWFYVQFKFLPSIIIFNLLNFITGKVMLSYHPPTTFE